ncbi:MAG TPA: hypothetical protein VHE35_15430 [Kofleriaceae bacterium]|nr:hypothetical protein [Kofleriaceae bacterium]
MTEAFPGPDPARSRLRAAVARVDRAITALPSTGHAPASADGAPADGLPGAWADLVDLLALGPEPALRTCPHCRHVGMRAASRCGFCWQALEPLPALAADGG